MVCRALGFRVFFDRVYGAFGFRVDRVYEVDRVSRGAGAEPVFFFLLFGLFCCWVA